MYKITHVSVYMEARGTYFKPSLNILHFIGVSFWTWNSPVQEDFLSLVPLLPGACYLPYPALLCGSEDTVSGPRIFMASTLPADPCPQLPKLVLHKI